MGMYSENHPAFKKWAIAGHYEDNKQQHNEGMSTQKIFKRPSTSSGADHV